MDLIDNQTGKLKEKDPLKQILSPYFNKNQNISCSCGSGVTACVIALALHECGQKNASVYDGSWAEWGNKKMNMPIDTLRVG